MYRLNGGQIIRTSMGTLSSRTIVKNACVNNLRTKEYNLHELYSIHRIKVVLEKGAVTLRTLAWFQRDNALAAVDLDIRIYI